MAQVRERRAGGHRLVRLIGLETQRWRGASGAVRWPAREAAAAHKPRLAGRLLAVAVSFLGVAAPGLLVLNPLLRRG